MISYLPFKFHLISCSKGSLMYHFPSSRDRLLRGTLSIFRDEMALQTCWRITMMRSQVHHRTALMVFLSPIWILSHLILKRFNIFLFSRSPVSYIRSILTFSDETALEINVRGNTMCHQGCPEKMLTISMSQFYSSLVLVLKQFNIDHFGDPLFHQKHALLAFKVFSRSFGNAGGTEVPNKVAISSESPVDLGLSRCRRE